jgi:hypothetical protein
MHAARGRPAVTDSCGTTASSPWPGRAFCFVAAWGAESETAPSARPVTQSRTPGRPEPVRADGSAFVEAGVSPARGRRFLGRSRKLSGVPSRRTRIAAVTPSRSDRETRRRRTEQITGRPRCELRANPTAARTRRGVHGIRTASSTRAGAVAVRLLGRQRRGRHRVELTRERDLCAALAPLGDCDCLLLQNCRWWIPAPDAA